MTFWRMPSLDGINDSEVLLAEFGIEEEEVFVSTRKVIGTNSALARIFQSALLSIHISYFIVLTSKRKGCVNRSLFWY